MNAAIKIAFDAHVVELSHRGSVQEGGHCISVNLTVVIERAIQRYQHIFITPVVAYASDEAASHNVCAIKGLQINFTTVFDKYALGLRY